ncbi:MAG: GntR family transcriptional regulator [Chitinivibrionales bacterium]|nr:GntR family transcriptional regulator [Chitinivibrionales bacterium]
MTALTKALVFLRETILQNRRKHRLRLPAIRTMARHIDVSYETMRKAVNYYGRNGCLLSRPARGVTIDPQIPLPQIPEDGLLFSSPDARHLTWQKTLVELKRDILNGVFGYNEPLPSRKELQSRYGISYPTLKKALDQCIAEKLLVLHARSFITFGVKQTRSCSRLVVIGDRRPEGIAAGLNADEFLRTLEHFCASSGITLEMYAHTMRDNRLILTNVETGKECRIKHPGTILGFIYVAVFLEKNEARARQIDFPKSTCTTVFNDMLRMLWHFKRPVAVYTFDETLFFPAFLRKSQLFKFFKVATTAAPSRQVGRYLLSRGHKKIAYISPFHGAAWSQARLEGLRQAYREAGLAENVITCVLDHYESPYSFLHEANRRYTIDGMSGLYKKWKAKNPHLQSTHLEKGMHFLNYDYKINAEIAFQLSPLLKRAHKDTSITAWVAANDNTVVIIDDFLQSNSVSMPDDLSLISFDNSIYALRNRICSYDFNISRITGTMLQFLMNATSMKAVHRQETIRIDGVIIARASLKSPG